MYEFLQEVAGTSVAGHYVGYFWGLKNKARGLLARIDGDSDVATQEPETKISLHEDNSSRSSLISESSRTFILSAYRDRSYP